MRKVTDDRILSAISDHVAGHGYGPTVREVAATVGLSVHATHCRLQSMRDKGLITHEPRRPRTIRVMDRPV